jgi:prolyl-tRNA synthetase
MPTLWTHTLIPTLREVPAEAEVPSHRLMLRAGYLRKLSAGAYDYLPLGLRSLRKAMQVVREEMDAAGAVEVFLPALQPIELWERTGRREAYGDNLFVVQDRHGRKLALGPTHEEVITELVGAYIESYKDLPKTLYQIQTKFRDEFRPRFGVLRSREFQMKDAYSFHLKLEGEGGLDETYQKQFDAYCRIFERCGLPYEVVEAESGPIGGSASHEFMVPSPTGEDTILKSDTPGKANYAANIEKCEIGERPISESFTRLGHFGARVTTPSAPPTGDLEKVHTPACASIEDVATFFKKNLGTKLKSSNMLKTLVFAAGERRWVVAVVRGDHDVNEAKLRKAAGGEVSLADLDGARAGGFVVGFVGPHAAVGREDVTLVVDPDATHDGFWVTGANEADHHVKHFNWQREVFDADPELAKGRVHVADIRNAVDGDPSPRNDGGVLRTTKGIEIGHVFKLGDKYTRAMGITVLTPDNQRVTPIMGCYGIGVNRILASAIEREGGHDDNGIIWPPSIAPYAVVITTLKWEGQVREVAERLANELEAAQSRGMAIPRLDVPRPDIDVLIDNRDERPGVKFKDADLIGIPVRITVGDKGLAEGKVEIKARNGSNGPRGELVAVDGAVSRVVELLAGL